MIKEGEGGNMEERHLRTNQKKEGIPEQANTHIVEHKSLPTPFSLERGSQMRGTGNENKTHYWQSDQCVNRKSIENL